MESIFQNIGARQQAAATGDEDVDTYEYKIKMLIADAVDYDMANLSPDRETNQKYYDGSWPPLEDVDSDDGDAITVYPDQDEDEIDNRSHAVSTDVRDTVLAIMPSLIRIFCSAEDVVFFEPRGPEQDEMAKQATDAISYCFWEENEGFLLLHDIFKDALINNIGIVKWWTENYQVMREKTFENITIVEAQNMIQEYNDGSEEPQVAVKHMTPPGPDGTIAKITIQYVESTPKLCVVPVPPEEFRIDRRARRVFRSRLVGSQTLKTSSECVQMGYPRELVDEYKGNYDYWSVEASIRVPGIDTGMQQSDLVLYGEYFIYADQDDDGIDELHKICTMGGNFDIVDDEIVDEVNYAVFCGDPKQHTVIGDAMASLVRDIQDINTQILRGALDSLSKSMFSDLVINQMTTNVQDVMADGVGKIIRTTTDPNNAVKEFRHEFVGNDAFSMMTTMDGIRQRRTGISEASKGIDPKALQSTNQVGVDAIVTGAQERIELIARIFAETGFKNMFQGMLREMVRAPNKKKTIKMRGKWVSFDPSLFDPNMTCKVNPTMGKGSDMSRLQVLQGIKDTQMTIISQYGIGNPYVHPSNVMNTITDMAAIGNVKNITRYFQEVPPDVEQQIIAAPKEPSAEDLIAQSTLQEVKAKTAIAIGKSNNAQHQSALDEDFRRDKLEMDTWAKIAQAMAKVQLPMIEAALAPVQEADTRNAG